MCLEAALFLLDERDLYTEQRKNPIYVSRALAEMVSNICQKSVIKRTYLALNTYLKKCDQSFILLLGSLYVLILEIVN